jgi:hypothetical protein
MRCTRADGSVTWQKHERHSAFYSFHDLTHYAVETVLQFNRGFYGLIADGWSIEDTTGKGPRGKLSYESILVEHVVGLFDGERSGGVEPLDAVKFSALIEQMSGQPLKSAFTEQQLAAARQRIVVLHQQWISTPQGSSLELIFEGQQNS